MREGKGKGKGKERRTKPTCVHPSFLTSPWKRKLQPPTNKQPTTNQHPTNITNQHPTLWTALRWIAQHFALFLLPLLILFSLFESLFFPVGDPGCLLSSLPKRLHKMTGELPICIFGSPTIKTVTFPQKNPRRILGPHFPSAATFFSVIQMFF